MTEAIPLTLALSRQGRGTLTSSPSTGEDRGEGETKIWLLSLRYDYEGRE